MDRLLYQHVLDETVEQYPGLMRVLGEAASAHEMAHRLFETYGHVLYPQELYEIGAIAIEHALNPPEVQP